MPRILIADDDADHLELFSIVLSRCGYDVVTADAASTAMELIAAGGVDAALLDVRMPLESGIELCERLRADPAYATLPIMLVSADVCGTRVTAALQAGADDYVTKPFHRADLAARLESLLLRRRPAQELAATAALLASRAAHTARASSPAATLHRPDRLTA